MSGGFLFDLTRGDISLRSDFSERFDDLALVGLEIPRVSSDLLVGEYPNMGMGHFIADDLAQDEIRVEGLALSQGYFLRDFEISAYILMIPDPTDVLLGDDLGMSGGLRVYVEESQEVVVFVDDVRGDLSRNDFTKYAGGGHTGSLYKNRYQYTSDRY